MTEAEQLTMLSVESTTELILADIDAVLAGIPPAYSQGARPIAFLYVRTAKLPSHEHGLVQSIARQCSGFLDPQNGMYERAELVRDEASSRWVTNTAMGEVWVRLSGEASRNATRDVSKPDRDAIWRIDFRHGDVSRPKAKAWREKVLPGLRALGCQPGSKLKRMLLPSLAPLILAQHWSDAMRAAVFLAGNGVRPRSDEWAVLVDQAIDAGQPWAEDLALLSARREGDVIPRALGWVYARERPRGMMHGARR